MKNPPLGSNEPEEEEEEEEENVTGLVWESVESIVRTGEPENLDFRMGSIACLGPNKLI
jgi:hypothetical protein